MERNTVRYLKEMILLVSLVLNVVLLFSFVRSNEQLLKLSISSELILNMQDIEPLVAENPSMDRFLLTTPIKVNSVSNLTGAVIEPESMKLKGGDVYTHERRALFDSREAVPTRPPKKIFIDLGAFDGQSIAYFMGDISGGNLAAQGGGEDAPLKGLGASGEWEVVVMEANAAHAPSINKLKLKYESKTKGFTFYSGTAVQKKTGTVNFIFDTKVGGNAGATTMPESFSAIGQHNTIPALGITDLFKKHDIQMQDTVALKMDIEGYEFELLRYMIRKGMMELVDMLAVEYHDTNFFVFGRDPNIREKYVKQHECVAWMMKDIESMKRVHWG